MVIITKNLLKYLIENKNIRIIYQPFTKIIYKIIDNNSIKKNIIVFLGHENQKYSDNSKYLFLKFIKYYSDKFNIYWFTPDQSLIDSMNKISGMQNRFIYQYSFKSFKLLLSSKFIISSSGTSLPISFSKNTIGIQLWHGIPIKAMGIANNVLSKKNASRIKKQINRDFKFWICSSENDKVTTIKCTGLPSDRVIIAGYPRNDYLIENSKEFDTSIYNKYPYLRKKIILYAPTWRENENIQWFPFENFSTEVLQKLLDEFDAYILIRGHHQDDIIRNVCEPSIKSKRIISANRNVFEDVQELLPHVDILISDYSGIWVDFLLLNRPIIFIPYDLEKYKNIPGIMYNYNEITPGPKISSFSDFIDSLSHYLINPNMDSDKRIKAQNFFHTYNDGKSYERIMNLIQSIK